MSQPHQQDQEVQAAADAPDQFFRELEIQFLIHELKDPIAIIETGLRTLLEKREKFGPPFPQAGKHLKAHPAQHQKNQVHAQQSP